MQIENVSLIEVIAAARARHASLVVESTGYLMLGIVKAMGGHPLAVSAHRVLLNTEGVVTLPGQRRVVGEDEAAAALHGMLRTLLGASQGVGTALRALAAGAPPSMDAFITSVTKSLIPLNRSASKRALGRLARETVRARNRGQLTQRDLEAVFELESQASEPVPSAPPAPREPTPAPVAAERVATPSPSIPVAVAQPVDEAAAEPIHEPVDWDEIDANIELATPVPMGIALATPTPAPVVLSACEDDELEMDCDLDDLDDLDALEEEALEEEDLEEEALEEEALEEEDFEEEDALEEDDLEEDELEEDELEEDELEDEAVAAPGEAGPLLNEPVLNAQAPPPVSVSESRAPFIPATPLPSIVDETPSPMRPSSGTPTIVDATLYRLTSSEIVPAVSPESLAQRAPLEADGEPAVDAEAESSGDTHTDTLIPERVSILSVQLPPAEPLPLIAPVVAEPIEVADAVTSDDEDAIDIPRISDIEREADLAERLLDEARERASNARPGSVEALLETFGADSDDDSVSEAAASLKRMMRLDPTPAPPPVQEAPSAPFAIKLIDAEPDPSEAVRKPATEAAPRLVAVREAREHHPEEPTSDDREAIMAAYPPAAPDHEDDLHDHDEEEATDYEDLPMDVVPSVSPPPVHVADADPQHLLPRLTPTELEGKSPLAQRALFFGTTFLLAGAFVIGFLYWQHPHTLGLSADRSTTSAMGGASEPAGPRYADLTLKDLPTPHEVLLRLGQAPFSTRALPTGVTLELLALAPGHQPKRVIVSPDAEWIDATDGTKTMALAIELMPGETNGWPDAPAGEVGGVGPKGTIDITAKPADAEVWLVVGAGDTDRSVITVPCETTAHILVLNPREPTRRRRLSVEPQMLEAARHAGGAELSVKP